MTKICFIDPSFTYQNPSTNSLVRFAEDLLRDGEKVEIWSHDLEPTLEGRVTYVKLPLFWAPWLVKPFVDFLVIHFIAILRSLSGKPRAQHVVVTGFLYLPADFATVHFSHFEWFKQLRRASTSVSLNWIVELLKSLPGYFTEMLLYYNPWRTHLLPVSDAVAADIKRWAAPWKSITVIPNMVMTDRCDVRMRSKWRKEGRAELKVLENETILAFCATGHFFRKGLSEAVATVMILRSEGRAVRLLVIGGREKSILRWLRILETSHGDISGAVIFTGMVDNPPYYLSCTDAFFFPSRCEAFSLVEIEAATLGLPLFLTPHHGSEMILKEGVNGHLLPWHQAGMAKIIAEKIDAGLHPLNEPDTGRALSRGDYRLAWYRLLKGNIPQA
jgi:glycosyltransferase involved in cell wall biosynthesis